MQCNVWFTSDTHFNHANIIPYEKPRNHYASVDEMNRDLVARWNARVKPDDIVYHLGDVALGKWDQLSGIIAQLNGSIELVLGNHDWSKTKMLSLGMKSVEKDRIICMGTTRLWLAHAPSNGSDRVDNRDIKRPYRFPDEYDLELCAHVHSFWKTSKDAMGRTIVNVGVDVWDMQPISLEEILAVA